MIIQIKVNKGGIGKSFITSNLGHLLSLLNKKVLVISTDTQNNIYSFFYKDNLKSYNKVSLRNNLDFIPIKSFGTLKEENLKNILDDYKKNYDYILIDSVPTMKVDDIFLKQADKIIIPASGDKLTCEGIVNILKKYKYKTHSIVFNKFTNTNLNKKYYNEIKNICENSGIIVTSPIRQSAYIQELTEKGKTIFESKSTKILDIQQIFAELVKSLI